MKIKSMIRDFLAFKTISNMSKTFIDEYDPIIKNLEEAVKFARPSVLTNITRNLWKTMHACHRGPPNASYLSHLSAWHSITDGATQAIVYR